MSDDVVSLNLDGSFAGSASEAAEAGDKLASALDKLGSSAAKAKLPEADRLKVLEKGAERAASAVDKLAAAQKKIADGNARSVEKSGFVDALAGSGKFASASNLVGKLFGERAKDGLQKGAASLGVAADELGITPGMLASAGGLLKGAGGVVLSAGETVLKAAAALAAAGVAVAAVGFRFAVEKTSEKQIQSAILDKLGAKGGFELALKLAADFNLDEGDALTKVKGLLGAKFSQAEIPALVRIAVGIGAVKGEEKGKAFLEKLETQAAKGGKASEEAVKGFAEAGVDTEAVYKSLAAKLGISVDQAKAKVKAGSIDMKDALAAVKDAAGKQFGDIADKMGDSVPGQINKLKIALGQLFADVDLGPLKDFLKSMSEALAGPGGAALKSGIKDLFAAISHALFDPFKGEEGKKKLERMLLTIGSALKSTAEAVNAAAPYIAKGIDLLDALFGAHGGANEDSGIIKALHGFVEIMTAVQNLDPDAAVAGAQKVLDALFGTGTEQGSQGGGMIGQAIVDGLTNAIVSGAGGAIASVVSMVEGVIAAARGAADAHSPSRKMGALGADMGDGLTDKLDAANDNATRAGADLASAAVGGAAGATGGAGGALGGAGGGGAPIVINVYVTAAPGMTPAQAQAIGDVVSERVRRELRAVGRERGERAA
jgi:hypothetical protein